ncbi:MAG: hypothetical protein A2Y97_09575 [Nitrospirae bacterium RBG_13_39_12]|nr:MAG: hypothetical protein A2Y97_09575 [Nitrospirae bacterium RBG_13_39_12]
MKKIYVGNIPFNATEQEIKDLFSEYGEVKTVKMITDKFTGQFRGFCFIEMEAEDAVQKAISGLNGKQFMEKTLNVSEARPQQPRAGFQDNRRGGYSGGYGGGKSSKKGWR